MKSRTADSTSHWLMEEDGEIVAKRNARERKRVEAVNNAFIRLRRLIPLENRGKRVSKVKTLHRAIQYIVHLQKVLQIIDSEADINEINGYFPKDDYF